MQLVKQQSDQQSTAAVAQQELLTKRLEAMRDSAALSMTALQESMKTQLTTMRGENGRASCRERVYACV